MTSSTDCFDIIVVGAGPAGAMAAHTAAGYGRRVCIIDRHSEVGTPVRCGEGIGFKGFSRSLTLRPEWILSSFSQVTMHSPSKKRVALKDIDASYIIDRSRMEPDLVEDAQKLGATVIKSTTIIAVSRTDTGMYECVSDTQKTFSAPCLIIADGIESRLASFLGWNTTLAPTDLETCAIARVSAPSIDNGHAHLYFGSTLAPGGYVWIFPRKAGEANVGLGVLGSRSSAGKPMKLLRSFIQEYIPDAIITNEHCGSVPVGPYVKNLVRGGALLVGDAARQVDCLHGGGIAYSLYAGKLAGRVASNAFVQGNFLTAKLKSYTREWASDLGKQQLRTYALKKVLVDFSDKQLDGIATVLSRQNPSALNYMKVHMQAFVKHPILLIKAFLLSR